LPTNTNQSKESRAADIAVCADGLFAEVALDEFDQTVAARLKEVFPQAVRGVTFLFDELTVVVERSFMVEVCQLLRDDPALGFYMRDLSAVDLWPAAPRFQLNLHLLAIPARPQAGQGARRLRLTLQLEEHDAVAPTLSGVWPPAAWYERETRDLLGIEFEEHPDPRPLLLPDDWGGPPPLRRDAPGEVEEIAFSFSQERIQRRKRLAQE
jgi:NADH-quinone oxidoreductase subunit C